MTCKVEVEPIPSNVKGKGKPLSFVSQLDPAEDFGGYLIFEKLGNENVYNNLSIQVPHDSRINLIPPSSVSKELRRYAPPNFRLAGIVMCILSILLLVTIFLRQTTTRGESSEDCFDGSYNIYSTEDFLNIPPKCPLIRILSLDNFPTDTTTNVQENDAQILEISASMDLEWILRLIERFPSIKTLHIDANDLCSMEKNQRYEESSWIKSPTLVELKISNFMSTSLPCDVVNWILRGQYPQLKLVKFYKIHFEHTLFQNLVKLIERPGSQIETIEISESYLCPQCDFSTISTSNSVKSIFISDPPEIPITEKLLE